MESASHSEMAGKWLFLFFLLGVYRKELAVQFTDFISCNVRAVQAAALVVGF